MTTELDRVRARVQALKRAPNSTPPPTRSRRGPIDAAMSAAELREIREALRITQEDMAPLMYLSLRQYKRLEGGKSEINRLRARRARELLRQKVRGQRVI